MLLRRTLLIFTFLVLAGFAWAGYHWWAEKLPQAAPREFSGTGELKKVMEVYGRLTRDAANIYGTIRLYDRENKDALKETRSFRFVKVGGYYYTQLGPLQVYSDSNWLLQLDTVSRKIFLHRKRSYSALSMPMTGMIDGLFSDTAQFRSSVSVIEEGRTRKLVFYSEWKPEVLSSVLVYDTISYRPIGSEMEWLKPGAMPDRDRNKSWLIKAGYEFRPVEPMDIPARMASIVVISDGRAYPAAPYQDYQLELNNN